MKIKKLLMAAAILSTGTLIACQRDKGTADTMSGSTTASDTSTAASGVDPVTDETSDSASATGATGSMNNANSDASALEATRSTAIGNIGNATDSSATGNMNPVRPNGATRDTRSTANPNGAAPGTSAGMGTAAGADSRMSGATDTKTASAAGGTATTSTYQGQFQSAVLHFEPGQATLNASEAQRLRAMMSSLKTAGGISQIQAAVWSDKELPMNDNAASTAARADRDLADKRINAIKKSIGADTPGLQVYNMADSSNWLARTYRSSGQELDSAFAKQDASAPRREEFDMIKREGGPQTAVVLLKGRSVRK